ncbi:MAG TPA: CHAD domain-containing protein [Polyangiaceae bacterium]|jgi:CHAD domain-containing protein|nr:CHAD domain-containing protein [Polyangiaceae bacterium]
MSQHFEAKENTAGAVRRIAHAELDEALRLLSDQAQPVSDAVHETRKKIKRLRALLRLVRGSLGAEYRNLNSALRKAAGRLSVAREAAAALEALDGLAEKRPGQLSGARIAEARKFLSRELPENRDAMAELYALASAELDAIGQRVARIDFAGEGWPPLEGGVRAGYRRARRRLAHASNHLDLETFHELRKAVKAHQYQLQLFEPAFEELIKARREVVAALAELLGEHHDLALLGPSMVRHGFEDVAAAAYERSAELEQRILRAGRRLFAERPQYFTATLGAWFEDFRAWGPTAT